MTREQKEMAWARKVEFARQQAGHYGKVVKIKAKRWALSDGVVIWEYLLTVTDEPLWSRERYAAHHRSERALP